ncbi:MAG: metallophosphoesterase [Myxococcales bacterium]|nr:metallophosphoesterase [Myxococcales bacterium]
MSFSRYAVFALVVALLSGAIHGYLWLRLVHTPLWPAPWPRVLSIALVVLALWLPATILGNWFLPDVLRVPVAWIGYVWLGTMFLLFSWCLLLEVPRVALWVAERIGTEVLEPDRRQFLGRVAAAVAGVGALSMATWGLVSVALPLRVKRVTVSLPGLPKALHGFRIVQLTDIHVGPTIGGQFIDEIVAKVNELGADMVAITGDLVDGSVDELGDAVRGLSRLQSREGTYFVTGNHEYYSGADAWVAFLGEAGIRVLRNERVAVERGDGTLYVAGVDDHQAVRFGNGHGADFDAALGGREPGHPTVLLAHQPKAFHSARKHGVDLQLSGHTHGGQIFPFGFLVRLAEPFVLGLHRVGQSQIYVSGGTGYWGPPMRVGVPAEITLLTLESSP